MARRFILALLVALVISGAAVFIIYRKMARTASPVAQTPIEYVAAGHLAAGQPAGRFLCEGR
jgi:hypothetical protein